VTGLVPTLVAIVILLAVWQVAAMLVGHDIILVTPARVVVTLVGLLPTASFWATIVHSLVRVVLGFLLAFVFGLSLAWLASTSRWAAALTATTMRLIRSIPVVSFIILLLIWADATWVGLWVSFLMVLPVIYANTEEGFSTRDAKILDMALVFGFTPARRWWAITAPGLMPYLIAATRVGFGLAWKAGVSAEVIGMTRGSIGERLYQAKIFLSTADLFAWTAVIVAASYLCEILALWGLRRGQAALGRYAA